MNKLIKILILLSFLLLPFDSIPKVLPSEYRPVSIWFITIAFPLIAFIVFAKRKQIKRTNLILVIFYIYATIASLLISHFKYQSYIGFLDFFITLTIGIITFLVCDYYFMLRRNESFSDENYIDKVFSLLGNIYIPVLIYGVYETLVLLGVLPGILKDFVHQFLAGRGTQRLQLFSGEPSWATFHLIFALPIYNHLRQNYSKYNKYFYIAILILLFTFSMQGYLIVILALLAYLILTGNLRILFRYLIYLLPIGGVLFIIYNFLVNNFGSLYFVTRFTKLNQIMEFSDIFYLDGSVFIRTMFPIVGLLIFKDNPIFGIGGGNYRFELGEYINEYFPKGTIFSGVNSILEAGIGNSFNMFSRLLSETGMIGSIIYMVFLYQVYIKIRKLQSPLSKNLLLFFLFVIFIYMQFDSFAFIQIWIGLAIINNLRNS